MKVQDSLFKNNIGEILRISFSLVLSMFELLQHQRHESTEKHGQINHGRNTGMTINFLKNAM